MLYLKQIPARPLSDSVEYVWLLRDVPRHATERILPTGTLELVVNLDADAIRIRRDEEWTRLSGFVVSGAYGKPFTIDTAAHGLIMGAHFRSGRAGAFIRAAPGDLRDLHVDAECLWGASALELRERLCAARTDADRLRLFEDTLHSVMMASSPPRTSGMVPAAVDAFERGASVRDVVARLGVSHRHFAAVFREEVGMSPKLFSRVRRFQRTLASAERGDDWAGLAAEYGYYDQAHLIRDFTAFAGSTPGEWERRPSNPVKDHHVSIFSKTRLERCLKSNA